MILTRPIPKHPKWFGYTGSSTTYRAIPVVCPRAQARLYVEWGRLGEIGDLYVLSEHRRKGLARRLVEHAKAWCRTKGCSAVSVTITPAGERPQSILRPARLRSVRSNKRLSNARRLI